MNHRKLERLLAAAQALCLVDEPQVALAKLVAARAVLRRIVRLHAAKKEMAQ